MFPEALGCASDGAVWLHEQFGLFLAVKALSEAQHKETPTSRRAAKDFPSEAPFARILSTLLLHLHLQQSTGSFKVHSAGSGPWA